MKFLPQLVSALIQDKRGNFAVITAITLVPILLSIGAAVDMGLYYRNKTIVQSAIDAAALAAAKQFPFESDHQRLEDYARSFFTANTTALVRSDATMTYEGTEWRDDRTRELKVSSCLSYRPIFLPIMNVAFAGLDGSACAETESVIIVGNTTVEVAMVLDTSGSMSDSPAAGGSSKIATLRTQAQKAVESLYGSGEKVGDDDPVRIGVVPFSGAVNVGPSYLNADWMDTIGISSIHHENLDWSSYEILGVKRATHSLIYPKAWVDTLNPTRYLTRQDIYKQLKETRPAYTFKGCVEARVSPYALTDAEPTISTPDTLFVPYFAPDEGDNLKKGWVNSYLTDSANGSFDARTQDVNKYYKSPIVPTNATGANNSYSPNYICDSNPLQALSANKATTVATIKGLVASGSTNLEQGVGWGWRILSKRRPFTDGRAAGDKKNIKAIILMTDGENTYYTDNQNSTNKNLTAFGSYGFAATERIFDYTTTSKKDKNNSNYTTAIDARTAILCKNAKDDGRIPLETASGVQLVDENGPVTRDGIIIYTIAFDIPAASKARVDALLKGCASYKMSDLTNTTLPYAEKSKNFYSAANSAQLDQAFSDIMASLSSLRIAR